MNVRVSKDELQRRLADIQSVVEKKTTMPILSHFLMSVGGNSYIVATDLETAIKEPVSIMSVKEGGDLCIPARKLYEIVREMDGDIDLASEETNWLKILSGRSSFRIACMNPEDFPKWPKLSSKVSIGVDARVLLEMIEKTLFSAGESDTRYTLNSLLFHVKPEEKTLTVVGSDGHRLATLKEAIDTSVEQEIKVIIPRKSAAELKRFLSPVEGTVNMDIATNHISFSLGEIDFLVRLIEGTYPSYEHVIPTNNEKKVGIRRDEFIKVLRRVSVISRDRSSAVRLDITPDVLTISASNPDIGEAKDELAIDYDAESISLGYNARYLLDALNAMTGEKVIFEIQEPLSPTLLREEDSDRYRCVIMPMRI